MIEDPLDIFEKVDEMFAHLVSGIGRDFATGARISPVTGS